MRRQRLCASLTVELNSPIAILKAGTVKTVPVVNRRHALKLVVMGALAVLGARMKTAAATAIDRAQDKVAPVSVVVVHPTAAEMAARPD